jgi:hypothetical protein
MLVMGSQIPFRDAYDLAPGGARKWLQRPFTVTHRGQSSMPTIVGECAPLPDGEWEFFAHEVSNSGALDVSGNPHYPAFHQPTWYLEITADGVVRRIKSYGAGAMTSFTVGEDDLLDAVWAVSLAIGAAELLAARLPWSERLEVQPVHPGPDQLAYLLSDVLAEPRS